MPGAAFDGLDVDTQAGAVRDDLVQQDDARGVDLNVRGENHDRDDQAGDVHGKAVLAARHPLAHPGPGEDRQPRVLPVDAYALR
ncbi:hypothetical protein ABB07_39575 (plasmid) [Streptomyces incarnatus]|uniref:Uncharacterized protein n=1 Tax=Streptomyces incarnatus TaxID=665007 RepID=A0ABN4GQ28_9ACTN|nr:hypothetical protein ABB07_39575 [Streptomyces incarnatus]